jgi:hypothetical protein
MRKIFTLTLWLGAIYLIFNMMDLLPAIAASCLTLAFGLSYGER